jgi:uncharacterized membrane protein
MTDVVRLTGEKYDHEIAAIFDAHQAAEAAAENLRETLSLKAAQVEVLDPDEKHPGRALEPESRGIFGTLVRAHFWLGIGGALLGFLLFQVLLYADVRMIASSPMMAGIVLVGFGAVAGLMLGGLVTLRPDHDPYIFKVRAALQHGRSAVLVHGSSPEQRKAAESELDRLGGEVVHSL